MSDFPNRITLASGEILTFEPEEEGPFGLLTPPMDISLPPKPLEKSTDTEFNQLCQQTFNNQMDNPNENAGGAIKRTYKPREKRSIDPKFGKEMTHIDHQTTSSYR